MPHASTAKPPHDSYRVIEGRVLAGLYPGDRTKHEARANLEAFLDTGVTCFLDLTEEGCAARRSTSGSRVHQVPREQKQDLDSYFVRRLGAKPRWNCAPCGWSPGTRAFALVRRLGEDDASLERLARRLPRRGRSRQSSPCAA